MRVATDRQIKKGLLCLKKNNDYTRVSKQLYLMNQENTIVFF